MVKVYCIEKPSRAIEAALPFSSLGKVTQIETITVTQGKHGYFLGIFAKKSLKV
jgi:hypothetical protein